MLESTHSYYCAYCQYSLYGASTEALAAALNKHNERYHPADCTNWTATGVTLSVHYTDPAGVAWTNKVTKRDGPLPQYTEPYGTTSKREWGDAKSAPNLTAADQTLLTGMKIKW